MSRNPHWYRHTRHWTTPWLVTPRCQLQVGASLFYLGYLTCRPAVGLEALPLDPLYNLSIDFSQNPLGWDIDEEDFDLVGTLNGATHESPPSCWPVTNLAPNSMPRQVSEAEQGTSTAPAACQLIRDAQPPDSPWVSKIRTDARVRSYSCTFSPTSIGPAATTVD